MDDPGIGAAGLDLFFNIRRPRETLSPRSGFFVAMDDRQ
jgi:hypothetical protein